MQGCQMQEFSFITTLADTACLALGLGLGVTETSRAQFHPTKNPEN